MPSPPNLLDRVFKAQLRFHCGGNRSRPLRKPAASSNASVLELRNQPAELGEALSDDFDGKVLNPSGVEIDLHLISQPSAHSWRSVWHSSVHSRHKCGCCRSLRPSLSRQQHGMIRTSREPSLVLDGLQRECLVDLATPLIKVRTASKVKDSIDTILFPFPVRHSYFISAYEERSRAAVCGRLDLD